MVRYTGAEVQRMEDPRLLTGHGRFVDDIKLPDMLYAAFLRSSHAHARIRGIDTSAVLALAGVHGVFTQADLAVPDPTQAMNQLYPAPVILQDITQHPMATDEVCYVGQTVALVAADSRAIAEDALALIAVDYEPLPAVVDCRTAQADDAPLAHAGTDSNLGGQ